MADIKITLDPQPAIRAANEVKKTLDKLESKARTTEDAFERMKLRAQIDTQFKRLINLQKQAIIKQRTLNRLMSKGTYDKGPKTLREMTRAQDKLNAKKKVESVINRANSNALTNAQKDFAFHQMRAIKRKNTLRGLDIQAAKSQVTRNALLKQHNMLLANSAAKAIDLRKNLPIAQKDKDTEKLFEGSGFETKPTDRFETPRSDYLKEAAQDQRKWEKDFRARINKQTRGFFQTIRDGVQDAWRQATGLKGQAKDTAEITPSYGKDIDRALDRGGALIEKINKKGPRGLKDYQEDFIKIQRNIQDYNRSLAAGEISLKKFNKGMRQSKRDIRTVRRAMKRAGKQGTFLGRTFTKMTRILVAMAAVMFIWQKMRQALESVVAVGEKYIKVLSNMQGEIYATADGAELLAGKFMQSSEDTVFGVDEMYTAYKELLKLGIGHNAAMEKTATAAKIARHEMVSLSDAAYIAAYGTDAHVKSMLMLNDALEDTAGDAWGRFKKSLSEITQLFYKKYEPRLVDMLNKMSDWLKNNIRNVEAGLKAFATALEHLGKAAAKTAGFLAKVAGALTFSFVVPEPEIGVEMAEANLDKLLKQKKDVEQLILDTPKTKRQVKVLQYYGKELHAINQKILTATKVVGIHEKIREDANNKAIEGSGNQVRALQESIGIYQQVYKKLGITMEGYRTHERAMILKNKQTMLDVATTLQDTELAAKIELLFDEDMWNQLQKELKPTMDAHKEYFETVGKYSDIYYQNELNKIYHHINALRGLGTEQKETMKRIKKAGLDTRMREPIIKEHKKVQSETGIYTPELEAELRRKAETAVNTMRNKGIFGGDFDLEMRVRLILENKITSSTFQEPLAAAQEYFNTTNKLTKNFVEMQKGEFDRMTKILMDQGFISEDEAKKMYDAYVNGFKKSLIEPTLEAYEDYLSVTGQMTKEYWDAHTKYMEKVAYDLVNIQGLTVPQAAKKIMIMELEFDMSNADKMLSEYNDLQSATGKMSAEHYETARKYAKLEAQRWYEMTGDKQLAYEALTRKLRDIDASYLESHNDVCDGIQAGFLRLVNEVEPLAKMVSDAWVEGFHEIDQAFKETFEYAMGEGMVDLINGQQEAWETLRDLAIGVLESIRDMAVDVLYQMVKSWVVSKFQKMFSLDILSKQSQDAAASIMKQIGATTTLIGTMTTEIGTVATLTAEYWLLAAAKAAAGVGGMGMGGGGGGLGGGSTYGGVDIGVPFQHGGVIDEMILGIGQKTGTKYSFGEHGTKEYVVPENQLGEFNAKYQKEFMPTMDLKGNQLISNDNTTADTIKLSQVIPQITNQTIKNAPDSIIISVPVSVEGNQKLAGELRNDIERLVEDKLREHM